MTEKPIRPAVILAGGLGTRLREETETKPKPMVDVGGYPMLWHIMKHYASFGVREFVLCLGYKGDVIKNFFMNYRWTQGSLTIDLVGGDLTLHDRGAQENWQIHLLDTGLNTMTGGRIKRAATFLRGRSFFATYGDGVSNVDIAALSEFHERQGGLATLTAVRPPARFGGLEIEGGQISRFMEKPQTSEGWINGGFMVMEPGIAELIESDETILEREPLETLADRGQLGGYLHEGFWQCMDTVRDLTYLRELWEGPSPPWKSWS